MPDTLVAQTGGRWVSCFTSAYITGFVQLAPNPGMLKMPPVNPTHRGLLRVTARQP